MRANEVTLFSNGIGHFRRAYKVGEKTVISIPFKRDHIGDVAASLQVFGPVRLATPPSFTPSNANATSLHIDPSEAYLSMLRNLSGTAVKIRTTSLQSPQEYTLVGTDTESSLQVDGSKLERHFLILKNQGAVRRYGLWEVTEVDFVDVGVRTEIEKALKTNFQAIKPDSTLLDLTLSALQGSDAEAIVQYTIPVAAWKMRYAIRQEENGFTLEGAAIIDNNTDEDWDNFKLSVVTGNPISFGTDIATVCVPHRKQLKLVDGNTLGNVDVEESIGMVAAASCAGGFERGNAQNVMLRSMSTKSLGPKMSSSTANYCQFGMEKADVVDELYEVAESAGVESKEVGDFCVFTSKEPLTILARKSAVVPMFTVSLTKAGVVLFYKESNHARRPFRAIKFKNETEYSLGKGKTVIYNSGVFSGECVLESTKPGENRMLPHCLENGVKIVKETKPVETRRSSLKISEGVGIIEDVHTSVSTYTIENKKDEAFKLAVDHIHTLGGMANLNVEFSGADVKEKEKLASGDGTRVYLELAAKQTLVLTVTEVSLNAQRSVIGGSFHWLKSNVIDLKNPLSKDKQVLACVEAQYKIDKTNNDIAELKGRRNDLKEQASRVRENLGATKDTGHTQLVADWVRDLDSTEKEIRQIDTVTLPKLNTQLKDQNAELFEVIKKVSVVWKV